jgi:hypothetical protein
LGSKKKRKTMVLSLDFWLFLYKYLVTIVTTLMKSMNLVWVNELSWDLPILEALFQLSPFFLFSRWNENFFWDFWDFWDFRFPLFEQILSGQ